jgi:hypothetical protein
MSLSAAAALQASRRLLLRLVSPTTIALVTRLFVTTAACCIECADLLLWLYFSVAAADQHAALVLSVGSARMQEQRKRFPILWPIPALSPPTDRHAVSCSLAQASLQLRPLTQQLVHTLVLHACSHADDEAASSALSSGSSKEAKAAAEAKEEARHQLKRAAVLAVNHLVSASELPR